MAHLVLGYPTLPESILTAEAYIAAGCAVLELQIPFSHPTADGPRITEACRVASGQNGVTIEAAFEAVAEIRRRHPNQQIVVMSYLNPLFVYGLEKTRQKLLSLDIHHLIVPDLPVDSPLAQRLRTARPPQGVPQHLSSDGLAMIPVLAANVTYERLDHLLGGGFDFFYLMSDFKITGATFSLHPRLKAVVNRIHDAGARCGIGFGIATPEQARVVVEVCGMAIVGSAFIHAQNEGRLHRCLADWQKVFLKKPETAW